MGTRFPDQKDFSCFFVTTTFFNWQALGKAGGLYESMADSLRFCARKYNAELSGYVFMPTHIHLLIFIDGANIAAFMRDFKKYVAQKIIPELKIETEKVWKKGFDRVAIETETVFRVKLEYIHNNPVIAGEVSNPEDWKWSSARAYFTDDQGIIPIFKDWT